MKTMTIVTENNQQTTFTGILNAKTIFSHIRDDVKFIFDEETGEIYYMKSPLWLELDDFTTPLPF